MPIIKILVCIFILLGITQSSKAQDSWYISLSKSVQKQSIHTTDSFPKTYISSQVKQGSFLTDLNYVDDKWHIVTSPRPYLGQTYRLSPELSLQWIKTLWGKGFDITKISYVNNNWLVIMCQKAGYVGETWAIEGTFTDLQHFIREQWKKKKKILNLAYGNGQWLVSMTHGSPYLEQTYKYDKNYPSAWILQKQQEGYAVTNLAFGGGTWAVVVSKTDTNRVSAQDTMLTSKSFPADRLSALQEQGYAINHINHFPFEDLAQKTKKLKRTAIEYINNSAYAEAIEYINAALILTPGDHELYNYNAWAKYQLKLYHEALKDADQALILKETAESYHTRGAIHYHLYQYKQAIQDFNSSITYIENSPELISRGNDANFALCFHDRALARIELGNYEDALRDLQSALEYLPEEVLYKRKAAELRQIIDATPAPKLVWDYPSNPETFTTKAREEVRLCIYSEAPIKEMRIALNGRVFKPRGFTVEKDCTERFEHGLPLRLGRNEIYLEVVTSKGVTRSEKRIIFYQPENTKGAYHALLIGVSDYDNDRIPDLKMPQINSRQLAQTLAQHYTFSPKNITVLNNPTKEQIYKKLLYFEQVLNKNDKLLIFYSGHGSVANNKGYWLPRDADPNNKLTWVPNSRIKDFTHDIPSKHTLIIADACYSGSFFIGNSRGNDNIPSCAYLEENKSRCVLTSSDANTIVPDNSVFFKYLNQSLQEQEASCTSIDALFYSLQSKVNLNSPAAQVPQYGPIQRSGHENGAFIFKRK